MRFLMTLFILINLGCTQRTPDLPTDEAATAALEQLIRRVPENSDQFTVRIRKTDGRYETRDGVDRYTYFYEADVSFPNGYRANCVDRICIRYDDLNGPPIQPSPPGTTFTISGSLNFERRESGWVSTGGDRPRLIRTIVSSDAGAARTTAAQGEAQVVLSASGPSACAISWSGAAVSFSEVLDRASAFVNAAIEAQGGPSRVERIPPVRVRIAPDAPYRCFAQLLRSLARAGLMEVHLPWPERVEPLVLKLPPVDQESGVVVEPMRNTIDVDAAGNARWNNNPADTQTLRTLFEQTTHISPIPETHLQVAAETPYRHVEPILVSLKVSGIEAFRIAVGEGGEGAAFTMYLEPGHYLP